MSQLIKFLVVVGHRTIVKSRSLVKDQCVMTPFVLTGMMYPRVILVMLSCQV